MSLQPAVLESMKMDIEKAAKVLRILEENFIEWRQVKHEEGLTDDNAVARYLLDCRKQLVTMQESSPQHTHNSVSLKLVC